MSASTLERLRTITHDAGAAAGHGFTEVSGAAIDALASVDADRIAGLPGALVGGIGDSFTLTRRLSPRRIVLGVVGAMVAAAFVAVLVVRSRRSEESPFESDLDARRDVRMAG